MELSHSCVLGSNIYPCCAVRAPFCPMPVPSYLTSLCCSSLPSTTSKQHTASRPRGLWKARGSAQPRLATTPDPAKKRPSTVDHYDHDRFYVDPPYNDVEHIVSSDSDSDSSYSSSSKRRKLLGIESPPTSEDSRDEFFYWDYSRKCTPHPNRESKWTTRSKLMDTSSTVKPSQSSADRTTCDIEDWEDLKELFAKAVEMYEGAFGADLCR